MVRGSSMEMSSEVALCASSTRSSGGSSTAASAYTGPTVVVSVPSDDKIELATDLISTHNHAAAASAASGRTRSARSASSSSRNGSAAAAQQNNANGATNSLKPQESEEVVGENGKEQHEDEDFDHFEDLALDTDEQVPLGEILDKLDASAEGKGNLIRLHAASPIEDDDEHSGSPTISATVNVATLDLSDPESIHQHLTNLNDTVLKVTTTCLSLNPPSLSIAGGINTSPLSISLDSQPSPISPKLDSSSASSSSYLSPPPAVISTPIALPTSPVALPTSPVPPAPSLSLPISPLPPSITPTSSAPTTPTHCAAAKRSNSTGSKASPQVCGICSKPFSNASALAKHRLTHSEERRYQCSICSKAFKRQDHLNGHLLTHRSTKPFACLAEGCGKSYCDARSLRRHKENHHPTVSWNKGVPVVNGGLPPACSNAQSDQLKLVKEPEDNLNLIKPTTTSNCDNQSNNKAIPSSLHQSGLVVNTKGLSPQQVQLIEQLFKESKNLTSIDTNHHATNGTPIKAGAPTTSVISSLSPPPITIKAASSSSSSSAAASQNGSSSFSLVPTKEVATKKTDASIAASNIAAKALAAVQNQAFQLTTLAVNPTPEGGTSPSVMLAEKPVECTMCSRKFKNIPALNGHMRLHGGYYKKDAEGRRILNTGGEQKIATPNGFKSNGVAESGGRKRKRCASPVIDTNKLSPETIRMLQQRSAPSLLTTTSGFESLTSPSISSTSSSPSPGLTFRRLPPPNTNQLLANLARKASSSNSPSSNGGSHGSSSSGQPLPPDIQSLLSGSATPTTSNIQLPTAPVSTSNMVMTTTMTSQSILSVCKQPLAATANGGPSSSISINNTSSGGGHLSRHLRVNHDADKTPRIGPEYQVHIPEISVDDGGEDTSQLLWDPRTAAKLSPQALQSFMTLSSSCLVPGGSRNEELAFGTLQSCDGNIRRALLTLMSKAGEVRHWTDDEVNTFYGSLVKYQKDFSRIARDIPGRTTKECVEYYYLWKNLCREEAQSFKSIYTSPVSPNHLGGPQNGEGGGDLVTNGNSTSCS